MAPTTLLAPRTDPLAAAMAALQGGRAVVLLAAQPVLVAPARGITAATVTLFARDGRGLVCHAMTAAQMLDAGLPLIPAIGAAPGAWRYAVSYEAGRGCGTGISAADRALTLNAGSAVAIAPGDIVTPGHIVPVLGDPEGDPAHAPSAALRMMARAGLGGGAALCAILDDDGHVADAAAAARLAARLGLVPVDPGALQDAPLRAERRA